MGIWYGLKAVPLLHAPYLQHQTAHHGKDWEPGPDLGMLTYTQT